ncbi:HINT domain-containing protein [Kitasatospora purpeofusca]|uniref:polymorphic toxin-type HINT domain-containing protein n=1 Tax=Kitasatospora purpeofusca TaxID=67352 RepID=UPI00224EF29A|nr:polymorphic toxin-type HINT domain-containing protein [Kitasatospora purpeofusca]MCX4688597.1 HINT domain-containing protein [Kitasatospora purpeofusca]
MEGKCPQNRAKPATTQRWTPAENLQPGHQLTTVDGRPATVKSTRTYNTEERTAYNLTVADLHTYYVLAANSPVLVHNCSVLSWRASQIQDVRYNPKAKKGDGGQKYNSTTVAVVRAVRPDGSFIDVVAGSGRDGLSGAQKKVLRNSTMIPEIAAPNVKNLDAELTALEHIDKMGWTPVAAGASRNICAWCEDAIRARGGTLVGPLAPGRVNRFPFMGERDAGF